MTPEQIDVVAAYESHTESLSLDLSNARAQAETYGSLTRSTTARASAETDTAKQYYQRGVAFFFTEQQGLAERRVIALTNNLAHYQAQFNAYLEGIK